MLPADGEGPDPSSTEPAPALFAFVTRALLDTAFNVWFDQHPEDVGAMVDDLFRKLRAVTATRRKAAG